MAFPGESWTLRLCSIQGPWLPGIDTVRLPPSPGAAHHAADIAGGQFKYERHGEFYRISVVTEGGAERLGGFPMGPAHNIL